MYLTGEMALPHLAIDGIATADTMIWPLTGDMSSPQATGFEMG